MWSRSGLAPPLGWRWGRGSSASTTVLSPTLWERWILFIIQQCGGGGGGGSFASATVYKWYQSPSTGKSSFASSTVCLPLGVGGAHLHFVSPTTLGKGGGGPHLYHPQCASLYLGWRWGRGSFASTTVCLPLPRVGYTQCHTHWVEGGGAHLHHP